MLILKLIKYIKKIKVLSKLKESLYFFKNKIKNDYGILSHFIYHKIRNRSLEQKGAKQTKDNKLKESLILLAKVSLGN